MHHSLLGPGLILFAAPALAISAGQPKGLIRSSYSIVPYTSTSVSEDPRDDSFSYHSYSSSSSSAKTSASTGTGFFEKYDYWKMFTGMVGPCKMGEDLKGTLDVVAPIDATYIIDCQVRVGDISAPMGQEDKVYYDYSLFGPLEYQLKANQKITLPALFCPKEHLVDGTFASFWIHCHVVGFVQTSCAFLVMPQAEWVYDLPRASEGFGLPASLAFCGYPKDEYQRTNVTYKGFSDRQTILSNGQIPFSSMQLTIKDDPRRLSTLSKATGTLTLNNHIDDFASGKSDGVVRTWELTDRDSGYVHTPILKTPCLYNPATGQMRDGTTIRGSEFFTNDFYLPPCKKEEVGIKQYSFSLSMSYHDVNGTFTIRNSFTIDASSIVASGCENGDFCVGVR
jgi:hypothetical protein